MNDVNLLWMYYGMKSCYKVTVMYRHRYLLYLTISAITFFSADFANFIIDDNLLLLLLLLWLLSLLLLLLLYIIIIYYIILYYYYSNKNTGISLYINK